jgi:ATP-dependent Zn protease
LNNKRSNFTRIYFIGMAIIIIVMLYYAGSGLKSNNYKYNDLLNDLQNGKVTQLNISQNKEVPTGKVTVKLQDGSTKYVYITDVNQVISDIKDINDKTNQNIQPSIADVSDFSHPAFMNGTRNDIARAKRDFKGTRCHTGFFKCFAFHSKPERLACSD